MFPDERACLDLFERLRWPGGFVCDRCGTIDEPWRASRGLVCRHCRAQRRPLSDTALASTKTPLRTWVTAAWLVAAPKNGLSAKTLERTLGVSYHTAWAMLQRFRVAMVRSERTRLAGDVEVDETMVGGVSRGGKGGRGSATRTVVVVAVELRYPKGFGRCRLRVAPSAGRDALTPIVCDLVEPGSVLLTDAWPGYDRVEEHGYIRKATNLKQSPQAAHEVHPGVHRVASLLKRWLLGTHQGSPDPDHLQAYCEEFVFRFNRRKATHRGLVFHRLLEQLVATGPVREDDLRFGYWPVAGAEPPSDDTALRTLVVADRAASRLSGLVAADPRFARIAHARTAEEAQGQARGLDPDLVLIDGDRDDGDAVTVVSAARAAGGTRVVAVHVGDRTGSSREALAAAGADLTVRKPGRQNLLNSCADLIQQRLEQQ